MARKNPTHPPPPLRRSSRTHKRTQGPPQGEPGKVRKGQAFPQPQVVLEKLSPEVLSKHGQGPSTSAGTSHERKRKRAGKQATAPKRARVAPPPEPDQGAGFHSLPYEMKLYLFSKFFTNDVMSSVPLVNHQWRDLTRAPYVWKNLCFEGSKISTKQICSRVPMIAVKTLVLKKRVDMNRVLSRIIKRCSQLEALEISRCRGFVESFLDNLAKCKKLKRLTVNRTCLVGVNVLIKLSKLRLQSLVLNGAVLDYPTPQAYIPESGFAQLTELTLTKMRWLTDLNVQNLLSKLPQLTSLTLEGYNRLNESSYVALGNCTRLRKLELHNANRMANSGFTEGLTRLIHLQELRIDSAVAVEAKVMQDYFKSGAAKEMRVLNLSGCCNVDDGCIAAIAERCPKLTRLTLVSCWKVTDQGLKALAEAHLELTHLNLRRCWKVTDKGIEQVVTAIKKLSHLNTIGIAGVTSKSSNFIKLHRPYLNFFRVE